ncbi:23716_t:CDS:1, partial [Racocetra persica]
MSATPIKFSGSFLNTELLREFVCLACQQSLTEEDISERNYSLYVSSQQNQIVKEEYGTQSFYGLKFWLRTVQHRRCQLRKSQP